MANPLSVLIVEDTRNDALLMMKELQRGGFEVDSQRVDTLDGLRQALTNRPWDIVLSDYSLPGFTALDALATAGELAADIPFIVISGNIGEEVAVEAMKAGAQDYFSKENLTRLVPAVKREVQEAIGRRQRKQVEAQLHQAEERFKRAFKANPTALTISRRKDGVILHANERFVDLVGIPHADVIGMTLESTNLWLDPEEYAALARRDNLSTVRDHEIAIRDRYGRVGIALLSLENIMTSGEPCVLTMLYDISQRKQTENELTALYNATSYLFSAESLLDLGQQIVRAVVDEFAQVDCGLLLVDRNGHKLISLARAGGYTVVMNNDMPVAGIGLAPLAVRTRSVIYAPDVSIHPNYYPAQAETQSELVIPLRTAKGVIGVFDLQSADLDAFGEADQRILTAFAERVASAVENMQLYEQINRHAGELEWRVAKRTAELQRTKEHVEAIINNSSDAIVLAGANGNIQQVNPAFEMLFGYASDEILGRPLIDILSSEDPGMLVETIRCVIETGTAQRLDSTVNSKFADTLNVDIAMSPVAGTDETIGVICSIRDITERTQMEQELRRALDREKELHELKSRFVAMVSHEYRTPLTTILASTNLLKNYIDRMSTERKQEHFNKIELEVGRMTDMLDDILTVNRAESVGLDFNPKTIDLNEMIGEIVDETQRQYRSHHIHMRANRPSTTAAVDPKLMHQLIANLISNAVKYSDPGKNVSVTLTNTDDKIRIDVTDEGIGIPEDDQTHMFEIFHRGTNVGSRPGTGLGLVIIKRAVEAHGGQISFFSTVNVGTTFTIELPLRTLVATPSANGHQVK